MAQYAHTIKDTLEKISIEYNIKYFIETGTFEGDTTKIAQNIFNHVVTIELNEKLYLDSKRKYQKENTTFYLGDSTFILPNILSKVSENIIFFLDAHYAGEKSSRSNIDSPLIEELSIIRKLRNSYHDVIIIDDAGWIGKKTSINFKPEWKSKYFPNGGFFETDWIHITDRKIRDIFPDMKMEYKDDRIFIYT